MVNLAAKLIDALFREVKQKIRQIGITTVWISSRRCVCARSSSRLLSSLEVLRENLIVVLIISIFGLYLSNGLFFQV